jgi:hypothetical protein
MSAPVALLTFDVLRTRAFDDDFVVDHAIADRSGYVRISTWSPFTIIKLTG